MSRSPDCAIFSSPSCTRFSPKSRCPAAYASRMDSIGNVLETATRVTEEGSRPADRAAAAMRSRTSVSRSAIDNLLGQLLQEGLNFRGLRPARIGLQVTLERFARVGNLSEIQIGHPELVIRHAHFRVRLDRGLELRLGLGELAGVPENDALVVGGFGTAARSAAGG